MDNGAASFYIKPTWWEKHAFTLHKTGLVGLLYIPTTSVYIKPALWEKHGFILYKAGFVG